ncbi:hypothetical protein B0H12DRAFT_373418 [Mycena haematopus]|nr:hypothetical protein B0H12DRAFT_373418 [Mycena haematopus]
MFCDRSCGNACAILLENEARHSSSFPKRHKRATIPNVSVPSRAASTLTTACFTFCSSFGTPRPTSVRYTSSTLVLQVRSATHVSIARDPQARRCFGPADSFNGERKRTSPAIGRRASFDTPPVLLVSIVQPSSTPCNLSTKP